VVSLFFRQELRVLISAFQEIAHKEDFEDRNLKEKAKVRNGKNESRSGIALGCRAEERKRSGVSSKGT